MSHIIEFFHQNYGQFSIKSTFHIVNLGSNWCFVRLKLSKIHHFRFEMLQNVPFSSNLVSSFWRENSNGVYVTKESLTFEKNLPLHYRDQNLSTVPNFSFFFWFRLISRPNLHIGGPCILLSNWSSESYWSAWHIYQPKTLWPLEFWRPKTWKPRTSMGNLVSILMDLAFSHGKRLGFHR